MSKTSPLPPPPSDAIDFEDLPWNLNHPEAHSYLDLRTGTNWDKMYDSKSDSGVVTNSLVPYSSISLGVFPAMTSLNYGTTVWEGLKCFRTSTGRAAIFRPLKNFERFVNGCERMCLPKPSIELFLKTLQLVVQKNGTLIPPFGNGMKLYIRPIMMGSGQQLGLYPSSEFSYVTYVSPTGNYFKGKTTGLKLHLETKYSRAAKGGMGSTKCSGNYAPTLLPLQRAKSCGFHDNLYIEMDTYVSGNLESAVLQELSAANIFLVLGKTGEIVTPSLSRGTVLPGVTRDSVLVLAREYGKELLPFMAKSFNGEKIAGDYSEVTVSERDITVGDLRHATEVFITGTAAEIVPIMSIGTDVKSLGEEAFHVEMPFGETMPGGPVTSKLLEILREVMYEKRVVSTESGDGWLPDPFSNAEEFRRSALGIKRKK